MNLSVPAPSSVLPPRSCRRTAAPFVPLKPISLRTGAWSVLLGVGLVTPLAVAIGLLHLPESVRATASVQARWLGYVNEPGALFLKAVIVMPLLEELFYRGLLLQLLRRYCPVWFAIGFSATFFGVTHLGTSLATAVNAGVLGGVFSWLVIRTGSLFPSLLCHAAINFAWLFLITPGFGLIERVLTGDPTRTPAPGPLAVFPAWWLATSLALALAAVLIVRRSEPRPAAR